MKQKIGFPIMPKQWKVALTSKLAAVKYLKRQIIQPKRKNEIMYII